MATRENFLKKVIFTILLIATFYHIYVVIHPFTPLSNYHISIFNLTQVKRAIHVFFLLLAGYLIIFDKGKEDKKVTVGGIIFFILSIIPLYAFFNIDIPIQYKIYTVIFWCVTILPLVFPKKLHFFHILAAILIFLPTFYMIINYNSLIYRAIMPEPFDLVMAFGEVYLVLALSYRTSGSVLPILVLFFILYNVYGDIIPGTFAGPGFDIDMVLGKLYCETEAGLFGVITGVSLKYLVYFTTLGAVIAELGFGRVISNIALTMVGKSPASPGRVSSILGVFMGLFSGSGAADTQFVATITKDLYTRAKYDRLIGAGIVATVGSIAYVTPPIMGTISFIMVEILSIPYTQIIIMALGPMLLYLLGIWLYNDFYVHREKLKPIEVAKHVNRKYALKNSYVFIPIILIIFFIYRGLAVNISVVLAIFSFIIIAYLAKELRPPVKNVFIGFAKGFESLIHIGVAVVCANIVMTIMVTSGLASKFSQFLTIVSHGNLLFALLFTAVFSLVLGMGVPPVATYVLTSALTAPAIQKLAIAAGIPENAALLATHMFLFYYAVLAEVTPPVGLSVYAASSVFGTNPIETGIYSALVALPKYLIGLSFICSYFGTGTLIVPILENYHGLYAVGIIGLRFALTVIAIVFLTAGSTGFLRTNLSKIERAIMSVCGVLLFYPHLYFDIIVMIPGTFIFLKRMFMKKIEDSC
jgi:TRAP transporter 4TM/12TM fusion protein